LFSEDFETNTQTHKQLFMINLGNSSYSQSYTLFYFKTRKIGRQAIICIKVLLWMIIFEYCEKHTEAIFQPNIKKLLLLRDEGWRIHKTLLLQHYQTCITCPAWLIYLKLFRFIDVDVYSHIKLKLLAG